jgi:hypothetical protein
MPKFSGPALAKDDSQEKDKKRWQKIMELPEDSGFYDLSTGNFYRRGMFKPIHRNDFENIVDEFNIIGTHEMVYVPFLRLIGDKKKCSLTGGA